MILYLTIAPTLLKPEVWHELIRIVKIKWFKWLNVFHKDVDIEAVACVHNLQYRFSTMTASLNAHNYRYGEFQFEIIHCWTLNTFGRSIPTWPLPHSPHPYIFHNNDYQQIQAFNSTWITTERKLRPPVSSSQRAAVVQRHSSCPTVSVAHCWREPWQWWRCSAGSPGTAAGSMASRRSAGQSPSALPLWVPPTCLGRRSLNITQ